MRYALRALLYSSAVAMADVRLSSPSAEVLADEDDGVREEKDPEPPPLASRNRRWKSVLAGIPDDRDVEMDVNVVLPSNAAHVGKGSGMSTSNHDSFDGIDKMDAGAYATAAPGGQAAPEGGLDGRAAEPKLQRLSEHLAAQLERSLEERMAAASAAAKAQFEADLARGVQQLAGPPQAQAAVQQLALRDVRDFEQAMVKLSASSAPSSFAQTSQAAVQGLRAILRGFGVYLSVPAVAGLVSVAMFFVAFVLWTLCTHTWFARRAKKRNDFFLHS